MPGQKDISKPGAVFVPPWAIYRAGINANDNLASPQLVTAKIDLTKNMSGAGGQIWITAQRTAGTGTCSLTAVADGFGSLEALKPYVQGETKTGVDNLTEVRFTGLIAVPHRILLTASSPGSVWTLHYTFTSIPI